MAQWGNLCAVRSSRTAIEPGRLRRIGEPESAIKNGERASVCSRIIIALLPIAVRGGGGSFQGRLHKMWGVPAAVSQLFAPTGVMSG